MLRNVSVLQRLNLLDVLCLVSIVTKQDDVTDVWETHALIMSPFLTSRLMELLVQRNCHLFFSVSEEHQGVGNKTIQLQKLEINLQSCFPLNNNLNACYKGLLNSAWKFCFHQEWSLQETSFKNLLSAESAN